MLSSIHVHTLYQASKLLNKVHTLCIINYYVQCHRNEHNIIIIVTYET